MRSFLCHFLRDHKGGVLVFYAITIPILMIFMAMAIESSLLQMRFTLLQGVANRAAEDALMVLANREWKEGGEKFAALCAQGNCPAQEDKASDYFTTEEVIQKFIKNASLESFLRQEIDAFIANFSPVDAGSTRSIDIRYPSQYVEGSRRVKLEIDITDTLSTTFLHFAKSSAGVVKVTGRANVGL